MAAVVSTTTYNNGLWTPDTTTLAIAVTSTTPIEMSTTEISTTTETTTSSTPTSTTTTSSTTTSDTSSTSSSSSATSSATLSKSSSSSGSSTASSSSASASSKKTYHAGSMKTIAPLVTVGCILLLLGLAFWFFTRHRRRKKQHSRLPMQQYDEDDAFDEKDVDSYYGDKPSNVYHDEDRNAHVGVKSPDQSVHAVDWLLGKRGSMSSMATTVKPASTSTSWRSRIQRKPVPNAFRSPASELVDSEAELNALLAASRTGYTQQEAEEEGMLDYQPSMVQRAASSIYRSMSTRGSGTVTSRFSDLTVETPTSEHLSLMNREGPLSPEEGSVYTFRTHYSDAPPVAVAPLQSPRKAFQHDGETQRAINRWTLSDPPMSSPTRPSRYMDPPASSPTRQSRYMMTDDNMSPTKMKPKGPSLPSSESMNNVNRNRLPSALTPSKRADTNARPMSLPRQPSLFYSQPAQPLSITGLASLIFPPTSNDLKSMAETEDEYRASGDKFTSLPRDRKPSVSPRRQAAYPSSRSSSYRDRDSDDGPTLSVRNTTPSTHASTRSPGIRSVVHSQTYSEEVDDRRLQHTPTKVRLYGRHVGDESIDSLNELM